MIQIECYFYFMWETNIVFEMMALADSVIEINNYVGFSH